MPRDEDKAWNFVDELGGGKWRCRHCTKESSGQVTRVKAHLLGIKGKGIGICTKVPNHERDQLLALLKNEGDPLLSLLKEEGCSREANRHSFTGGPAGRANFTDAIQLPSGQQSLGEQHQFHQSSTMPLVAQDNRFIANERPASVHSSNYLDVSSDKLLAHSNPQQASAVNMVDHLSWDTYMSHGVLPVQQDTSMPTQLQIISQSSNTVHDQSINFETGDQQQNQRMSSSLQNDQFLTDGASDGLQELIQTGVLATDPLNDIPMTNIRKDSYQPNHTFCGQHGGESLLNSSSPMYSTSWPFPNEGVYTSHGILPVQQDTSMPPQLQIMSQSSNTVHDQSINFETGDQQQNQRMSSSLQNDQFLTNGASDGLQELIQTGVLATDPLNDIPMTNIRKDSYQPNHTFCGQHGGESLLNSSSPMYSTSWPFPNEDVPTNDEMDPPEISPLGNEKSLQMGTSSFLQDCCEPCALEVVNTAQHSNQPHPRCDGESGIETNLFPSQDSMGVDPLSALQHSSDPHVSEKSNVNLQGPTDGINTAAQSIPSLDMNRGSPMLNQISICTNHEKMQNLKRKIEQLEGRGADIKRKMKLEAAESLPQMKPKTMVTRWLKKIKTAKNKFKSINEVSGENMSLKERVERLTREVEELRGKKLPRTLFIQAEPAKRPALLEHKLIGEAIQRNIELIWGCLMENRSSNLGISGMGGVGKTTIAEHIHNRLLKNGNFDTVIFCTVSQNFSIHKLQSDIWKELKGSDMEEERVTKRAAKLSEDLSKKKNFVLILDDVWEHFELRDVGIPHIADGCKLVLTTRSSEVCARMGCKKIEIRPLREEEAWNLFVEHLGYNGVLEKIKKVAKAIVEKCAGLPLAIITMARSMRGEVRSFYWKDTLDQLNDPKKDHTEMGDRVLPVLRHSYTRLSPQLQQCFLRCALYPEDASIGKMELIEFFIDEGLIDELHTREKQHNRGLTIISRLQDAFLLEYSDRGIKMHDLLRDMALHIMSTTSIVKVRMPDEECWTSDLERVSLMSRIEEVPPDLSPNCPKLSTLLLKNSLLEHMRDSFFKQLHGLKVLNLSGSKITEVPSSVSDLVNLRALVLCECYRLRHIPYLGKLKSLRKLNAWGCMMLEAVEGLQMLVNLRYLDLLHAGVKKLREGTLRRLVKLQLLRLKGRVNAEEMTELKALELFECHFDTVDELSLFVKILGEIGYNYFEIKVDQVRSLVYVKMAHNDPENRIREHSRTVEVRNCNYPIVNVGRNDPNLSVGRQSSSILIPGDVQQLTGSKCGGMKNLMDLSPLLKLERLEIIEWENLQVLCGAANEQEVINGRSYSLPFPCLKELNIQRCLKLKYLFGHGCKVSLPDLPAIVIEGCEEMEGITAGAAGSLLPAFPSLEKIDVKSCGNMKRVVEYEWLLHFPNLKKIKVQGCKKMVEIIGRPPPCMPVDTAVLDVSPLLKLELLEIIEGENLQVLCGAADEQEVINGHSYSLLFPCLKKINIQRCLKLKYLFGHGCKVSLPDLPAIVIEGCEEMEGIIAGAAGSLLPAFLSLEKIVVKSCGNMKRVVEYEWLLHFPNLKKIKVQGCKKMVEIIGRPPPCMPVDTAVLDVSPLLKLELLEIIEGENLQVLCGAADEQEVINGHSYSLLFPCLKKINIQRCLKLKYLFGHGCKVSLPDLRVIIIEGCEEIEGIIAGAAGSLLPAFPSLEEGCEEIEGITAAAAGSLLPAFPSLEEGCEEIEGITAVAAGSLLPAFPSLEKIDVKSCGNMKRVVEYEWLLHFPNLKKIKVQGCKKMVKIIGRPPPCMPVDTAVLDVSPLLKLELLEIIEGENLQVLCGAADEQEVINGHSYSLLFPCLKKINIQRCLKLKYLFGHGCKVSLPDLLAIVIEGCEEMEGIIAGAAVSLLPAFPSLEKIDVKSCGNMKRVVEYEWLLHFPNLKKIKVQGCKKMVEIIGRPPPCMLVDTAVLDVSPLLKLELLEIIEGENLQVLCGAADEQEVINGHSYSLLFPCLKKINIQRCLKLKYLFGHGCKVSLPDLLAIVIEGCEEMEGIIAGAAGSLLPAFPSLEEGCEEIEGITAAAASSLLPAFPSLEYIDVKFCGNMKRVVESEWLLHFPNLKEIYVRECKKMVEIIGRPPPCMPVDMALLVAHLQVDCCNIQKLLPLELLPHLRNLQCIQVNDCTGMEEIVSRGSASTPEHIPSSSSPCPFHSLPQLKHLLLENLPDLKSVCESTISCLSIRLLSVSGCPKLERISLQLKPVCHGLRIPNIDLDRKKLWDTLAWDGPDQDQLVLKYVRAYNVGKNRDLSRLHTKNMRFFCVYHK